MKKMTSDLLLVDTNLDNSILSAEKSFDGLSFFQRIQDERETKLASSMEEGETVQREYGIFYTHLDLARKLMNDCHRRLSKAEYYTFLDPSVGLGAFLIAHIEECIKSDPSHAQEKANLAIKHCYVADVDQEALSNLNRIIKKHFEISFNIEIELPDQNIFFGDALGIHNSSLIESWYNRNAGFDIVASNPPYRLLKPHPRQSTNKRSELENLLSAVKESKQFHHQSGMLNLYKLFVERMMSWTRDDGILGLLIPRSLLADSQSKVLRTELLRRFELALIYDIPENSDFFSGVGQAFSMFAAKKGNGTSSFQFQILGKDGSAELTPTRPLTKNDLNSGRALIPIRAQDQEFVRKLESHLSVSSITTLVNLRGELDMTIDKKLIVGESGKYPLVQGQNIGRYKLLPTSKLVHSDIDEKKKASWINEDRIACQQISNANQEHRLKWCFVPRGYVLANSCNFIAKSQSLFEEYDYDLYLILGILNSKLLNRQFKMISSNNHISNSEISLLPLPKILIESQRKRISALAKVLTIEYSEQVDVELEKLVQTSFGMDL